MTETLAPAGALTEILVRHQRIPMYDGLAQRCSGCDHLLGESDGPNSPRHAEHLARLVADWYAERIPLTLTSQNAAFAVKHLRLLADHAHPSPDDLRAGEIAAACLSARYVAEVIEESSRGNGA